MIKITNISKRYNLYNKPIDRLKETFNPFGKIYHQEFYALRDISFEIGKGEIVGIIGKNGSGKSTLLQIITGVLSPSSGFIETNGKISALLELGAGFNPELTGLENVYFKSSLLGNSSKETDTKIDEILEFADIGDFANQPVKTYSSGMFVRLAFAVAINVDPDILIIDEALAVGDFRFRQKCLRKIRDIRDEGKTILFVSHDTGAVTEFCTSAIWLGEGTKYMEGLPSDVCKEYISYMSFGEISGAQKVVKGETDIEIREEKAPPELKNRKYRWTDVTACSSYGERKGIITKIAFCRQNNFEIIDSFAGGERVIVALKIKILRDIENPIAGFVLGDSKGIHILGMNTLSLGIILGGFHKGDVKIIEFEFDFPFLKLGEYAISPAIAEGHNIDEIVQHHWVYDAHVVRLVSNYDGARLGHYLVIKDNVTVSVD